MTDEKFIADGMAKIRAAIAEASSHEEATAGFEALLKHLVSVGNEVRARKHGGDAASAD